MKWFYIAMIAIAFVGALFPALEKKFQDPIAQQIEACSKSCHKMLKYDAENKICECKEK